MAGEKGKTFHVDGEDVKRIAEQAAAKSVKPSKILRYWLRLGMQTEPEIKAILT